MKINNVAIANNTQLGEGGTMTPEGKIKYFKSGYMIGITKGVDIEYNGTSKDLYTLYDITKLADQINEKAFKTVFGGVYIGYWKDNGKTYYDIVIKVKTKTEALKIAREHKEIAIWDNKNQEAIYL